MATSGHRRRAACIAALVSLALLGAAPLRAQDAPRDTMMVTGLTTDANTPDEMRALLDDYLLTRLQASQRYSVFGKADMQQLLNLEEQRQLAGCEQESCLAEIAGAMGARWLVSGQLGRIGNVWLLNLKILETTRAQVAARVSRKVDAGDDRGKLVAAMEGAIDELLAGMPREGEATTPWYQSWWFWTSVGVVAAGAASTAAIIATQPGDGDRGASFTVESTAP